MLERQTKCAEAVKNESCVVKSAFRFPERVEPFTTTKGATKGCGSTYNIRAHLSSARTKQEKLKGNVAGIIDVGVLVCINRIFPVVPF